MNPSAVGPEVDNICLRIPSPIPQPHRAPPPPTPPGTPPLLLQVGADSIEGGALGDGSGVLAAYAPDLAPLMSDEVWFGVGSFSVLNAQPCFPEIQLPDMPLSFLFFFHRSPGFPGSRRLRLFLTWILSLMSSPTPPSALSSSPSSIPATRVEDRRLVDPTAAIRRQRRRMPCPPRSQVGSCAPFPFPFVFPVLGSVIDEVLLEIGLALLLGFHVCFLLFGCQDKGLEKRGMNSLISLTSKAEIHYEGVLVSINLEESTIALRNGFSTSWIQIYEFERKDQQKQIISLQNYSIENVYTFQKIFIFFKK
ncbi:uncharacterized protein LOC103714790 isoform X1 [Phoenix dactylifera]|uniref:Uncharacterized protein LOC103714790 isoform X1 n=1 Tax=Phoenix dactylifera TaxID=42345 RepID=A0A8B9AC76_PHODC|nr:uncharacterized protein LOC103714790 isoform X1 [Phoenix dactylifera]